MIKIEVDTKEVLSMLGGVSRQLPYAMSLGLNRAAQAVKQAEIDEMKRAFRNPSRYTLNSLQLTPAHLEGRTKSVFTNRFTGERVRTKWGDTKLSAEVWFKQPERHSTHYLEPQVYGGKRHMKAWEIAMGRKFIMPSEYSYPDNKLTRGQITKLMNLYGEYSVDGFNRGTKDAAKKRQFFALTKAKNGLLPGIYQRVQGKETAGRIGRAMIAKQLGKGKQRELKRTVDSMYPRGIKPVVLFTREPKYSKRFDFFGVANRTLDKVLMTSIRSAVDDALKTARAYQPGLF